MRKICGIFLIFSFIPALLSASLAEEAKEHICFRVLDANQDNKVNLKEFEKYYENDKAKFHAADLDKDGQLTHDEYHDFLGHGSP